MELRPTITMLVELAMQVCNNALAKQDVMFYFWFSHASNRSAEQPPADRRMRKVLTAGEIAHGRVWLSHRQDNEADSDRVRMQASIAAVVGGQVKMVVDLDYGFILRLHLNVETGGGLHYLGAMRRYFTIVEAEAGNVLLIQDLGEINYDGVVRPVFGVFVYWSGLRVSGCFYHSFWVPKSLTE